MRFSARPRVSQPPLRQLDLERLATDEPFQRGDAGVALLNEIHGFGVIVIGARLVLLDPDPDQLSADVVTLAQRMQRRTGAVFLDDPALERGAVAAVLSRHRLLYSESPQQGENQATSVSNPRGALHMAADIRARCLSNGDRGVLPQSLIEADVVAGTTTIREHGVQMDCAISLFCSPRATRRAKRIWAIAKVLLG